MNFFGPWHILVYQGLKYCTHLAYVFHETINDSGRYIVIVREPNIFIIVRGRGGARISHEGCANLKEGDTALVVLQKTVEKAASKRICLNFTGTI